MKLVFDMECDGLRDDATQVWCIVAKDISTNTVIKSTGKNLQKIFDLFLESDFLIGHNIISYDLPLLKKFYNFTPREDQKIIDTLVLSRLLNPDRDGGHSIEAWGNKLGRSKPEHEDWSQYSEEMLHRCTEDVEINHLVYNELIKEMRE